MKFIDDAIKGSEETIENSAPKKSNDDLDEELIKIRRTQLEISTPNSKIKVFVIPTNEELVIARDTVEIVEAL